MTARHARLRVFLPIIALLVAKTAQAETIRVVVDKMEYAPVVVEAKVGDTIEWENKDFLAHTATVKGEWEALMPPGKSGSVTLTKAGVVDYFCRFHPNMKGRVVVTASDG